MDIKLWFSWVMEALRSWPPALELVEEGFDGRRYWRRRRTVGGVWVASLAALALYLLRS